MCRGSIRSDCRGPVDSEVVRKRAGIKFDPVGAGRFGAFNLFGVGIDEDGNPDFFYVQGRDDLAQEPGFPNSVPSVVAGQLVGSIGHQGALMGWICQYQGKKFRCGIAFDVEFRRDDFAQGRNIVETDMALIGSGVYRDALGPKGLAVLGDLDEVGQVAASGIAQQRHFVDIDREPCHGVFSCYLCCKYTDCMEEEHQPPLDGLPDWGEEIRPRPPAGPAVIVVLGVLLCLSLLLSAAGVGVFQALVIQAGWDESILSGILAPDASPSERWQMRLLLGISHFTTFILAGWVTVRIFYPPARASIQYLGAQKWPGVRMLLLAVLLVLVSIPLVLFLYQINKALPLPESFRLIEDQTNEALKGLLQMDSPLELLANLALIALLPAIGEELVFRGVVQQQLLRRIRQPWAALALTAAVFSFIHFQFEGFLPRMLLGLLLGWLYWVSGNFWVPVTAHFANNAVQVLGQFLYRHELSTVDLEQDIDVPWYAAAISIVLIWLLMRQIASIRKVSDSV